MKYRYLGLAEKDKDVLSAISLIKKVFYSEIGTENFILPKASLVKKNIVVIKENNEVVATSIINDRLFFLKNKKIPCSFLSFICVDNFHRNKGLSRILMDFSIKLCESRRKKACFVIARKSADYFYNKFSFYGFSNYPKIVIKNRDYHYGRKLNFVPLQPSLIYEIKEIYNSVYQKLLGSFFRNYEYWDYIIKKAKKINVKISLIKDSYNNFLGYICFDKGNIYELALNNLEDYPRVLKNLMDIEKLDSIIFHGGTNHPLANEIELFDYTVSYRKCWYGGHMIRINDEEFFTNLLLNENQKKRTIKNLKSQEYLKDSQLLMEIIDKDILPNQLRNIPLMDQI